MSEGMNVIPPNSDQPAQPGYDHSLFNWSAMPTRPPLDESVPRRLHLSVIVDLGAIRHNVGRRREAPPALTGVGEGQSALPRALPMRIPPDRLSLPEPSRPATPCQDYVSSTQCPPRSKRASSFAPHQNLGDFGDERRTRV
jgi:hypothetical protein